MYAAQRFCSKQCSPSRDHICWHPQQCSTLLQRDMECVVTVLCLPAFVQSMSCVLARRWMQVQSHCRVCPVCKAGIDDEKVQTFVALSTRWTGALPWHVSSQHAQSPTNANWHAQLHTRPSQQWAGHKPITAQLQVPDRCPRRTAYPSTAVAGTMRTRARRWAAPNSQQTARTLGMLCRAGRLGSARPQCRCARVARSKQYANAWESAFTRRPPGLTRYSYHVK